MTYSIKTVGGPFNNEVKQVLSAVMGWPPPINLPGTFHGGVYLRSRFSVEERAAEYTWTPFVKGGNVFEHA